MYVLRDPRDVLLSNARYLGAASEGRLEKFSRAFISNMGVPRWREMGLGSWPEHLASWMAATPRMPHLFVRYEDLRSDTPNTLKRMVRFLGLKPDDSKIRMAVERCALERAREAEIEDRKQGRASLFFGSKGDEPFVGDGKMGQSLAGIGEDIEKAYRAKFGNFVELFGYG
ncbi:MAG: sulfotransferase domain-containing protein [Betaproteobacteria bacterium]|nr:sulfotransferase domain-containing protein [Betaproteobacteria bacterium]